MPHSNVDTFLLCKTSVFHNKKINIDKIIIKKQDGGTKHREIQNKSATIWYFGSGKTESSERVIDIGDTIVNTLKEYKL